MQILNAAVPTGSPLEVAGSAFKLKLSSILGSSSVSQNSIVLVPEGGGNAWQYHGWRDFQTRISSRDAFLSITPIPTAVASATVRHLVHTSSACFLPSSSLVDHKLGSCRIWSGIPPSCEPIRHGTLAFGCAPVLEANSPEPVKSSVVSRGDHL